MSGQGGSTTKSEQRKCSRCNWKFNAITERLIANGTWVTLPRPNEQCRPCRDLLAAEKHFKTALLFYAKAATAYRSRWSDPKRIAEVMDIRLHRILESASKKGATDVS